MAHKKSNIVTSIPYAYLNILNFLTMLNILSIISALKNICTGKRYKNMKKKIIATILVGTLVVSALSGCGNSSQETVETVTQTETNTVETDSENTDTETEDALETTTDNESAQEEQAQNDETIDDESELAEEEFNEEQAFNKIAEMFNARKELFNQGSLSVDLNFLFAAECDQKYTTVIAEGDIPLVTKDGIDCDNWSDGWENGPWVCNVTTYNYFYNYVNNGTGYYSLEKYVQNRTSDEIYDDLGIGLHKSGESLDANEVLMGNAVYLLEYLLKNMESLEAGELLEGDAMTTEYTEVSGIPVLYQLPLLINGEYSHLDALYVENGNLLNIISNEVADNDDSYWLHCGDELDQLYSE